MQNNITTVWIKKKWKKEKAVHCLWALGLEWVRLSRRAANWIWEGQSKHKPSQLVLAKLNVVAG